MLLMRDGLLPKARSPRAPTLAARSMPCRPGEQQCRHDCTGCRLLEDGAEANAVCSPTRTSALQLCALRVLIGGTQAQAVDVAGLLLDHGADVRHRDHADRTALHLAAWAGAADLLDLLLRRYQVR